MSLGKLKKRSDFVAVRDFGVFVRAKSVNLQVCWAYSFLPISRELTDSCFVGGRVRILMANDQEQAPTTRVFRPAEVLWVASSLRTYMHGSSLGHCRGTCGWSESEAFPLSSDIGKSGSVLEHPDSPEMAFFPGWGNKEKGRKVDDSCTQLTTDSSSAGLNKENLALTSVPVKNVSLDGIFVRYAVEILEVISSQDAQAISRNLIANTVELECRILTPPQRIAASEIFANRDKPTTPLLPPIVLGITASRKVGNAVKRNLAKRRIRAWCQEHLEKSVHTLMQNINTPNQCPQKTTFQLSKRSSATLPKQRRFDTNAEASFSPFENTPISPLSDGDFSKRVPHSKSEDEPSRSLLLATPTPLLTVVYIAKHRTPEVGFNMLSADMHKALGIGMGSLWPLTHSEN